MSIWKWDGFIELGPDSLKMLTGSGSPEGVITAPVGSFYLRADGSIGQTFYVKESGTGNTGWRVASGSSTGGLTLETNGATNGSQSLLNLIAGSNVTLTDNGSGGVTITSTGGGGSGGTPASPVSSIQFNDAGVFGGFGDWDGTNIVLGDNVSPTGAFSLTSGIQFDVEDNSLDSGAGSAAATLTPASLILVQSTTTATQKDTLLSIVTNYHDDSGDPNLTTGTSVGLNFDNTGVLHLDNSNYFNGTTDISAISGSKFLNVWHPSDGRNAPGIEVINSTQGAPNSVYGVYVVIDNNNNTNTPTLHGVDVTLTNFKASGSGVGVNISTSDSGGAAVDGMVGLWVDGPSSQYAIFVNSGRTKLSTGISTLPATANAHGTTGEITWDPSFIYVCVNTNQWKRVGISTW